MKGSETAAQSTRDGCGLAHSTDTRQRALISLNAGGGAQNRTGVEGFAGVKMRSWTSTCVHESAGKVHSRSPTYTCVREGPAPSSRQRIISRFWEQNSDLVSRRPPVWVASAGPLSIIVRLPGSLRQPVVVGRGVVPCFWRRGGPLGQASDSRDDNKRRVRRSVASAPDLGSGNAGFTAHRLGGAPYRSRCAVTSICRLAQ